MLFGDIYMLVLDLVFLFMSWLFSILCFLVMVRLNLFPFIILFIFFLNAFFVHVLLFALWLFGCVAFLFSEIGGSLRFACSCLSILDVSIIILVFYSLFVFWCISSISGSGNQPLFYCPNLVSESLACGLKTSAFMPDLYHSFSISS